MLANAYRCGVLSGKHVEGSSEKVKITKKFWDKNYSTMKMGKN